MVVSFSKWFNRSFIIRRINNMAKNKELYVKCSCGRENIVTWTSFLGFKGHWKANQKCPSCRKKMV